MPEQRRIGYRWNLRALDGPAQSLENEPNSSPLQSRGINLSESQIYRLVTGTPGAYPRPDLRRAMRHLGLHAQRPVRAVRRATRRGDRERPEAKRGHRRTAPVVPIAPASPVGGQEDEVPRPRKPSDPVRWPVPCGRCNQHHEIVAHWPDARSVHVLLSTGQAHPRHRARCGHQAYSQGRIDGLSRMPGMLWRQAERRLSRPVAPRTSSTPAANAGTCHP